MSAARPRLAVVLSHPTQYYSPWFRRIAALGAIDLRVYYLWDFGVQARHDRDFGQALRWDIPLMDGYMSEFVPNRSPDPGTHHFSGLDNPGLARRLAQARPDAILLFGYAYRSQLGVMLSPRLAVPAAHIRLVPHCVDNDRFRAGAGDASVRAMALRRELGIAVHATVVLFAGKFEQKKRPLDLLAAFLRIEREAPAGSAGAVLLLVGSGVLEEELRRMAGDALGRSVFFCAFQNQSQMPAVYAAADLLALASFGNGETWGLAVNEAMNLARPCLVSSHVGCGPDLVREGETGWLFKAGDPDALHAALERAFAAGPVGRARMGRLAQARVEEYSFDVAAAALRDALASLPPPATADIEGAP